MRSPSQKGFRKNYYSMAVFFFMTVIAFKLSGTFSGIFALTGLLLANPAITIRPEKYRWWVLLALFLLSLALYPSLNGLKS